MKAETICPKCREKVITDCIGCVSGKMLWHVHNGEPYVIDDIDWKILEVSKKEEQLIKSLNRK